MLKYFEDIGLKKCAFQMWLLENFKLNIWIPLYFYWTTLVCRKETGVYRMILIKSLHFVLLLPP